MKSLALITVILSPMSALAQGYSAPPAPIAHIFNPGNMPNVSTQYVTFCLGGVAPCVERRVKAWGQMCYPFDAKSPSNHLDGEIPPGFVYTSWRCVLANPNDKPPLGTFGKAEGR